MIITSININKRQAKKSKRIRKNKENDPDPDHLIKEPREINIIATKMTEKGIKESKVKVLSKSKIQCL